MIKHLIDLYLDRFVRPDQSSPMAKEYIRQILLPHHALLHRYGLPHPMISHNTSVPVPFGLAIGMRTSHAYKNLSAKSDFSQMHPTRSGFDYECIAFHTDLIVNEFKRIGLIGCLIMSVPIVKCDTYGRDFRGTWDTLAGMPKCLSNWVSAVCRTLPEMKCLLELYGVLIIMYKGRPVNKSQNGILFVKFQNMKNPRYSMYFVGNLFLGTSCEFYYDDDVACTLNTISQCGILLASILAQLVKMHVRSWKVMENHFKCYVCELSMV